MYYLIEWKDNKEYLWVIRKGTKSSVYNWWLKNHKTETSYSPKITRNYKRK